MINGKNARFNLWTSYKKLDGKDCKPSLMVTFDLDYFFLRFLLALASGLNTSHEIIFDDTKTHLFINHKTEPAHHLHRSINHFFLVQNGFDPFL